MFSRIREWLNKFESRVIVTLVIISFGCAGGIQQAMKANSDLRSESKDRRNQSCLVLEKAENKKREGLSQLYTYLENLPPEEVKSSFNQLIITRQPIAEAEAREESVPAYCDEPGIGLKEPGVKLPKKRDFSYLIIEPDEK